MNPELTDLLCAECGLCCDGTMFADVDLEGGDESTALETLGVEVDEGGEHPVLVQPCTALHGRRCSIYPHRPGCCRAFECHLLTRTRQGDLDVDHARGLIADTLEQAGHIRDLLHQLDRPEDRLPLEERVQEALSIDEREEDTFESRQLRLELQTALARLQAMIRTHFAGDV